MDPVKDDSLSIPDSQALPHAEGDLLLGRDDLPWIANLVYSCRVDLQQAFNLNTEEGLFGFVLWVARSANDMHAYLPEDKDFTRFCGRRLFRNYDLSVVEATVYFSAAELREKFVFPEALEPYKTWFRDTFETSGVGGLARIAKIVLGVEPEPLGFFEEREANRHKVQEKPFGVNIIGYAYGQLGIGEDARMTAIALQKLGVPFCLVNFAPGPTIPQNDYSMHAHVRSEGPYQINLFCMTATETARYFYTQGQQQWLGRTNIGYWPWELDKWPTRWLPVNRLIDQVWVSSRHIFNALAPVCSKTVNVVPLHVDVNPVSPLTRADFNLPRSAKLFCFSFDLHSSIHRKNPQACIDLFMSSFPKDDPRYTREHVGLVIKTHKPKRHNLEWDRLKKLAELDDRVYIIEQTLARPDLLALYRCCDTFLSLHRAEGFGRGIAEAIMLGLEVVTTNYSGNIDFCQLPQCTLVDYELVPVQAGEYIEHEGMMWAGQLKLPQLSAISSTA